MSKLLNYARFEINRCWDPSVRHQGSDLSCYVWEHASCWRGKEPPLLSSMASESY